MAGCPRCSHSLSVRTEEVVRLSSCERRWQSSDKVARLLNEQLQQKQLCGRRAMDLCVRSPSPSQIVSPSPGTEDGRCRQLESAL